MKLVPRVWPGVLQRLCHATTTASAPQPFVNPHGLLPSLLLMAAVCLMPGNTTAGAARSAPPPVVTTSDLAQRIHTLVNVERKKHGLDVLTWNKPLAKIASKHSRDMAQRNYLSHDTPEGHDFGARYRQGGFTCAVTVGKFIHTGAENIALARLYNSSNTINGVATYDWNTPQQIAQKVVDGWMNSPGHRKNILTPHWKRQGIGVEIAAENKIYITQNFC